MGSRVFIAGGAGFIGSHFVEHLLALSDTEKITVYDNLSSGNKQLGNYGSDKRFSIVKGDIKDAELLQKSMSGHDTVIHLASNPDIARAATEPSVDFYEGTFLTHQIVEAMRISGTKCILYASGSGVYGDIGTSEAAEDFGPMTPISTYGASKLAGESLICAYSYMFGLEGLAFRFGNVVGPRQTHGVGFDFVRKLRQNASELAILGDGSQSKSYVYISDIIAAVLLAHKKRTKPFDVFNVATGDYITVGEIAQIAIEAVLGANGKVKLAYTGGDRGWKGDVPVVRLNTDKIKALGWRCQHSSRQAIEKSLAHLKAEHQTVPAGEGR